MREFTKQTYDADITLREAVLLDKKKAYKKRKSPNTEKMHTAFIPALKCFCYSTNKQKLKRQVSSICLKNKIAVAANYNFKS